MYTQEPNIEAGVVLKKKKKVKSTTTLHYAFFFFSQTYIGYNANISIKKHILLLWRRQFVTQIRYAYAYSLIKKKKKGENVLDVQNVLKNIIKRDIFRLFLRITAKFEFLIYKIDSHAHTTKIC